MLPMLFIQFIVLYQMNKNNLFRVSGSLMRNSIRLSNFLRCFTDTPTSPCFIFFRRYPFSSERCTHLNSAAIQLQYVGRCCYTYALNTSATHKQLLSTKHPESTWGRSARSHSANDDSWSVCRKWQGRTYVEHEKLVRLALRHPLQTGTLLNLSSSDDSKWGQILCISF